MKVVDDLRKRADFCGQVGEGDFGSFRGRGESPFVPQKQKGPKGLGRGYGCEPLGERNMKCHRGITQEETGII